MRQTLLQVEINKFQLNDWWCLFLKHSLCINVEWPESTPSSWKMLSEKRKYSLLQLHMLAQDHRVHFYIIQHLYGTETNSEHHVEDSWFFIFILFFFCRLSSALHHFSLASSLCWTKLHTTFLAQPLFTCRHWRSSLPSRRVALSSAFPPCSSLSVVMGWLTRRLSLFFF